MTAPDWREVSGSCDAPTGDRSLSYVAADRAFALFTDHVRHETILVRRPELGPEDRRVLANWRGASPGPRAVTLGDSVEGYGVFTFPYGPVSMGVPESGTFDLRTYGERILELVPGVGHKSRGIATAVVGRRWEDAALLVERLAGNFSASHVSAFLQATESAEQRPVPTPELWVRALSQEIQRIYNHLHVIARIAEAASQNVGAAQLHALAEENLRIAGHLFGHRWMFGALLPGGPPRRLDSEDRHEVGRRLVALGREFEEIWELFLVSRTFIDRIQATAPISATDAIRWGAVGPTLRACGVSWDDRLRVPIHPYTDLFVSIPLEHDGDALARVLVRSDEIRASLLLIEQMLDRWPGPSVGESVPSPGVDTGRGLARVEGPSGDVVYDVSVSDGIVRSLNLRTSSEANWPLFALGMRNAVFTDFHFALESFGLVFADTDG